MSSDVQKSERQAGAGNQSGESQEDEIALTELRQEKEVKGIEAREGLDATQEHHEPRTVPEPEPENDGEDQEEPSDLDVPALILLAAQEASSSFSFRAAEFAYPLYFAVLFTNTLLPASLYGFITTGIAILFSGSVGELTDRFNTHRLRLVRAFILAQKVFVCASYALFLLLFFDTDLRLAALNGGHGQDPRLASNANVWIVFSAITVLGCFLILSNVGVSVSVERDWVTSIANGSSRRLVRLNAIVRRIDLLSKLLAPLFVSLLTSTTGYAASAYILLGVSASTTIFELTFIGIVFRRFTILGNEEVLNKQERRQMAQQQESRQPQRLSQIGLSGLLTRIRAKVSAWIVVQVSDWRSFIVMPIFISSLTIAILYMSVLSFDPTFIAFLKSETKYSDAFIAGMRGVCVVAGLIGTFLSPFLVKRIGLVRTGTWSLWAELLPLTLSLVSLYQGVSSSARPSWNTALLFTGLSLSRIGLWSFDLAQLAQVQWALRSHPRRNALMGLQFSLQNLLDLFHYALTIIWSKPSQFRNAADVSFAAIGAATLLYTFVYARRERGHLLHLDKMGLETLLGRKAR